MPFLGFEEEVVDQVGVRMIQPISLRRVMKA